MTPAGVQVHSGSSHISTLQLRRPVSALGQIHREVFTADVTLVTSSGVGHGAARCMTLQEALAVKTNLARLTEQVTGAVILDLSDWRHRWQELVSFEPPGPGLLALSALDIAMWSLLSEERARPALPCYQTGLYDCVDDQEASDQARLSLKRGFAGLKMPVGLHPAEDICRVASVRDAIGGHFLAVDGFTSLAWDHANELGATGHDLRVAWLEDPFPYDQPHLTRRLAKRVSVPIAGGEQCWTLEGLKSYLRLANIQIPILDIGRLGGISALATFFETDAKTYDIVACHVDPLAVSLAAHLRQGNLWLEFLDWWDAFEDVSRILSPRLEDE